MTATDVHDDIDAGAADVEASGDELFQLVASNDHKSVGRLWLGFGLLFLIDLAILAVLTHFEAIDLDGINLFGSQEGYQQAFTLVRTGGVFLVALPLLIGLATIIVPLQVGSPSIAFPRLAAAAFWAWLVGAGTHIASFIADGGLGPTGDTAINSTLLTITSMGVMILAVVAASICIATTIIALRPAGMSLTRVPMFTWSMLVASSVWLLSLPILGANLILAWADLQGRAPVFFGDPDRLWGDVEWAFLAPQIFTLAIPVLGILADIAPVSAKARMPRRGVMLSMIGAFGALSFGAWAQHAFSKGANPAWERGKFIFEEPLYALFGLLLVVPALGVIGGIADTIRRAGRPTASAGLVGALAGSVLALVAALIGALRVLPHLPWPLHIRDLFQFGDWGTLEDTLNYRLTGSETADGVPFMYTSASAMFWLVIAAVVAATLGAIAWWAPKIAGGYAPAGLTNLGILAVMGGGMIAGMMHLVTGFMEQPDLAFSAAEDAVGPMNAVAMIGVALLAVGGLTALLGLVAAMRSDEVIPDDPWDGHTLEWAAPSPPPSGNFVEPIGPIRSEAPLLDEFEEVS